MYERTGDAAICYTGDRQRILAALSSFQYAGTEVPEGVLETSGRELNAEYQEKLVMRILMRMGSKLFIPYTILGRFCLCQIDKIYPHGPGQFETEKAGSICVGCDSHQCLASPERYEYGSSVMFLLGSGELLEEWTHKKSVGDLARVCL